MTKAEEVELYLRRAKIQGVSAIHPHITVKEMEKLWEQAK